MEGEIAIELLIEILLYAFILVVGILVLVIFYYGLLWVILYLKKEVQILNNNNNKNIAKRVKEKMEEMGSCPNEMDIILNIINPKEFNRNTVPHCKKDCWNEECICNKEHKI